MTDFKSVQDLIIKAAIKGDKYSTTRIDLTDTYRDPRRGCSVLL